MKPPRSPHDYEDRPIDCQEALEDEFLALIDRAYAVGWYPKESMAAIRDLALNHIEGLKANTDTDRQIAEAMADLAGTKH